MCRTLSPCVRHPSGRRANVPGSNEQSTKTRSVGWPGPGKPASKASTSAVMHAAVSAAQLGAIVGVTARRITQLRDEGRIPALPGGRYRLGEAVAAYAAILRRAAGVETPGQDGGGVSGADLDAARVRLITAQAEAREMLNAQMRGEAILAEDLEAVAGALCDAVRAKVLALPTRAAPLVLGLKTLPEVRDVLTGLAHETLADLAAAAIVTTEEDRARLA